MNRELSHLKSELRAEAKQALSAISKSYQNKASNLIKNLLINFIQTTKINSVGVYWSSKIEVHTHDILVELYKNNISCSLPCIEGTKMFFRAWSPEIKMKKNASNSFFEPIETQEVSPNLLIIPGLLFDQEGGRLGHGKGHYDKYLSAKPRIKKVGLYYETLLAQHIPMENHDIKMDFLITEKKLRHFI